MADQEYVISAIGKNSPQDYQFEGDNGLVHLKLWHVKFDGSDEVIRVLRNPKSEPLKQGFVLTGELFKPRNEKLRQIRVRKNGNIGRTGQARKEDPTDVTWRIAVSIAYEAACATIRQHGARQDELTHLEEITERDARWLFALMRNVPRDES